jgi:trimeric autotransporter adhesin
VSVRFGDQAGLTYTIAHLNKKSNQNSISAAQLTTDEINKSQIVSKTKNQENEEKKSELVIENTEKIFDEKLTTFIRQNSYSQNKSAFSTNNTNSLAKPNISQAEIKPLDTGSTNINGGPLNQFNVNFNSERKIISPPNSSNKKHNNSSNIDILKNKNPLKANQSMKIGLNSDINSNAFNRLSFNDSCYFSSSSSSCSSSFDSAQDDSFKYNVWNKPCDININNTNLFDTSQLKENNVQLNRNSLLSNLDLETCGLIENLKVYNKTQNDSINNNNNSIPLLSLFDNVGGQNYDLSFLDMTSNRQESYELFSNTKQLESIFSMNSNSNSSIEPAIKNSEEKFDSNSFLMLDNLNSLLSNNNHDCNNKNNNKLYKEVTQNAISTAIYTDRSDTPSSCLTNESSASHFMIPSPTPSSLSSLSATMTFYENQNELVPHSPHQLGWREPLISKFNDAYALNKNILLASSSESSTSTTKHSDESIAESLSTKSKISGSDKFIEDKKDSKNSINLKTREHHNSASKIDEASNKEKEFNDKLSEFSNKDLSPQEKQSNTDDIKSKNDAKKKDESYCGYVESFPYYYKLNRLYNALAIQKMQTERLKKTSLFNQLQQAQSMNGSTSGIQPGSSMSNSSSPNQLGSLKGNNMMGTSPISNQLYSKFTSPSSSPSNFITVSPPQASAHMNFKNKLKAQSNLSSFSSSSPKSHGFQHQNNNNNANNNNNSLAYQTLLTTSSNNNNMKSNSQIGYPMSPSNAAKSFANHNQFYKNAKSNNQNNQSYSVQN